MALSNPTPVPRSEPIPIDARAADHLRYIRETMASAGEFTAVPGWGGVAMGITALAAAYFASQQATQARWLLVWLLEAGIAVAIAAPAKNRRNRNMVNLLRRFKENWNLHWNCEQVREAALRNT